MQSITDEILEHQKLLSTLLETLQSYLYTAKVILQEAHKLGLIKSKSGSMATAIKLTNKLKVFFPDDPTRADFALFGLGVDEN